MGGCRPQCRPRRGGMKCLCLRYAHAREAVQLRELRERGVEVRYRAMRHGKIQGVIDRFSDPFRAIRAFTPDAIILNQGGTFDVPRDPSAGRLEELLCSGPRLLVVCHGNDHAIPLGAHRASAVRVFEAAVRVCFVSSRMVELAERQLAAPIARAAIVRNPVRAPEGGPPPLPPGEGLRISVIARLDANKCVESMLEALRAEPWPSRDWSLEIAGEGPLREYLGDLARFYGLESRVRFLGHQASVAPVLARANLVALTSRSEGLPLSLLEGALAGRALLATDVGGVSDLVVEGVTGFLAEAPTAPPRRGGAAAERAWASLKEFGSIGAEARRHAAAFVDPSPGRSLLEFLDAPERGDAANLEGPDNR